MSTGLGLSEFLLSLLLSEGTMIAAAVILLVCIVVFEGCKKRRILRIVCAVLGLCSFVSYAPIKNRSCCTASHTRLRASATFSWARTI